MLRPTAWISASGPSGLSNRTFNTTRAPGRIGPKRTVRDTCRWPRTIRITKRPLHGTALGSWQRSAKRTGRPRRRRPGGRPQPHPGRAASERVEGVRLDHRRGGVAVDLVGFAVAEEGEIARARAHTVGAGACVQAVAVVRAFERVRAVAAEHHVSATQPYEPVGVRVPDHHVRATSADQILHILEDVVALALSAVARTVADAEPERPQRTGVAGLVVPVAAAQPIRPRAALEAVVAAPARQLVVALLSDQRLALGAADQRVVAGSAGQAGGVRPGLQRVVSGSALDASKRAEHVVALVRRAVIGQIVQANRHAGRVVGVRDAASGREAGVKEIGAGPSEELRRRTRDDDLIVTRPPVHRTAEISHVDQVVAVAELQLDAVVLAEAEPPAGARGAAGTGERRAEVVDHHAARHYPHRNPVQLARRSPHDQPAGVLVAGAAVAAAEVILDLDNSGRRGRRKQGQPHNRQEQGPHVAQNRPDRGSYGLCTTSPASFTFTPRTRTGPGRWRRLRARPRVRRPTSCSSRITTRSRRDGAARRAGTAMCCSWRARRSHHSGATTTSPSASKRRSATAASTPAGSRGPSGTRAASVSPRIPSRRAPCASSDPACHSTASTATPFTASSCGASRTTPGSGSPAFRHCCASLPRPGACLTIRRSAT